MLVAWITLWFHPLPTPAMHFRGLAVNNCIWYLLNYHKPKINTCLPTMTHVLETCGWRGQSLPSALVHHRLYFEAGQSRISGFCMSFYVVHIPDRDKLVWQRCEKYQNTLWVYIPYLQTVLMIVYLHTQYASGYSQSAVWFEKQPLINGKNYNSLCCIPEQQLRQKESGWLLIRKMKH